MKAQRESYCPCLEAGENDNTGAQSSTFHLKAKTPWSFTATCCCRSVLDVQGRRESRSRDASSGVVTDETPPFLCRTTNQYVGTSIGGQFGWGATPSKI